MVTSQQPATVPVVSVVTPFLNEREVLPAFISALRPVLEALAVTYEVIFVDDGSTDGGTQMLREEVFVSWPQARVLRFTKNFGHMAALTAGLDASRGAFVATMDSDLQHPPAVLAQMLDVAMSSSVEVVQGLRMDNGRSTSATKRAFSRVYYRMMSRLAGVELRPGSADFRVLSRRAVDELVALPESTRVYRLLVPWMGYSTAYVPYQVGERGAGRSKYTVRRMIGLGWSSLRSFSTGPLRLATATGMLTGILGVLWSLYVIVSWAMGNTVPGWSGLMCAVLILGGVQLVTIGIVGEYLAVVLDQVRGRPTYVLAEGQDPHVDSLGHAEPGRAAYVESRPPPTRVDQTVGQGGQSG